MKTKLKNNILKLRKQKGLTLEALANLSGTSKSRIHDLQYGENPKLETARKLAKGLGVSIDEIWPIDNRK